MILSTIFDRAKKFDVSQDQQENFEKIILGKKYSKSKGYFAQSLVSMGFKQKTRLRKCLGTSKCLCRFYF